MNGLMVKNYIFSGQKIEQQEVFDLNYFSVNFVSIQRSNSLFFEPEKKNRSVVQQ